ncbi:MAG: type II toxin-antitoxin system Phd/YefM family antitoxin [Nocardioides sp.]|nr:type II toxin-antitoxin system Phd/YefM family antitoxin [Nocardioides sp.]
MRTIGITELNQQTSRVLREVQAGERIDVTMHGRVVARLVPATPEATWLEQKKAEGRIQPPTGPDADLPDVVPLRSGLSLDELIEDSRAEG